MRFPARVRNSFCFILFSASYLTDQQQPPAELDIRYATRKVESLGRRVQVVVAPGKDHMGVARGMIDGYDIVFAAVEPFLQRETAEQVQ